MGPPPFPSNVGGRQKVKGSLKGKSYNQGSCLGQGCRSLSPPFLAMTSALFPALGEHTKIKDRSLPMPPPLYRLRQLPMQQPNKAHWDVVCARQSRKRGPPFCWEHPIGCPASHPTVTGHLQPEEARQQRPRWAASSPPGRVSSFIPGSGLSAPLDQKRRKACRRPELEQQFLSVCQERPCGRHRWGAGILLRCAWAWPPIRSWRSQLPVKSGTRETGPASV